MALDPLRLRALVHVLGTDRDGELATLAADVDLEEIRAETLCSPRWPKSYARAQISPATFLSTSPLPLDKTERASRIRQLAGRLTDVRGRELAYVAAYLVVIADLELAPVEGQFLDELRRALDDDRAAELAETAAQFLTPGTTPPTEVREER